MGSRTLSSWAFSHVLPIEFSWLTCVHDSRLKAMISAPEGRCSEKWEMVIVQARMEKIRHARFDLGSGPLRKSFLVFVPLLLVV